MSCNPEVNKKIMKIQQSLVKFKKPCSEWRWWCWFWWELLECSQDGFSFWVISRLYLFIRCCCLAHPSQLFLLTFCARVGWRRGGRSDQSQQKSLLNLSFPPCAGWWGSQFTLPVVTHSVRRNWMGKPLLLKPNCGLRTVTMRRTHASFLFRCSDSVEIIT